MPRVIEPKKGVIVTEYSPCKRSVLVDYHRLYLPFPYCIFIQRTDHTVPSGWSKRVYKTLHMGYRTEPLDFSKPLDDQTILYPLLPNFYARWLLCCSPSEINRFWSSNFGTGTFWAYYPLMISLGIKKYSDLTTYSTDQIIELCKQYPETVIHENNAEGLNYRNYGDYNENSYSNITKTKLTFKDVFDSVHYRAISHVDDVSNRYL